MRKFDEQFYARPLNTEDNTLGEGYPWRVTDYGMDWYIVNLETRMGKKIGPVRLKGTNYFDKARQEAIKRNAVYAGRKAQAEAARKERLAQKKKGRRQSEEHKHTKVPSQAVPPAVQAEDQGGDLVFLSRTLRAIRKDREDAQDRGVDALNRDYIRLCEALGETPEVFGTVIEEDETHGSVDV